MISSSNRILSIQSHVAFGYVGGKVATFPLQCLGYDVDVVNTANWSNHGGYGRFGGSETKADELTSIFEGMEEIGLLASTRLLTGHTPSAEALSVISKLASGLKKKNPDLIYLLDPVLGDDGRLYVTADAIPLYRSILHLATVITPNWFEVETLTGIGLQDVPSLQLALRILHERYLVPNVVISSIPVKQWLMKSLPMHIRPSIGPSLSFLLCLSSSATITSQTPAVHAYCVPLIPGYFSGVGDLFSALLLGHFHHPNEPNVVQPQTPLSHAASIALTKTHAVIRLTHAHSLTLPQEEQLRADEVLDRTKPTSRAWRISRGRELRLIQAQDVLRGIELGDVCQMKLWEEFWDAST